MQLAMLLEGIDWTMSKADLTASKGRIIRCKYKEILAFMDSHPGRNSVEIFMVNSSDNLP